MAGEQVLLNVYDLLDVNRHTACIGLGVFHSGVVVYNKEYAYGGHEFSTSGVFETPPRVVPGGARFRESLQVGNTSLSPVQVEELLRRLSREYLGNRYHLLYRNCNHFCEELCEQLTGRRPPSWVNRLASVARVLNTFTPCILPSSVRALARVPTQNALAERLSDTMPLLAARPRGAAEGDEGRATATVTGGACAGVLTSGTLPRLQAVR